jgi:hypothetical protein
LEPRFVAHITPEGLSLEVHADDVNAAEVIHHLVAVLARLTASPGQVFPTVTALKAQRQNAAHAKEHPATKLLVKEGRQLWLGDGASAVLPRLALLGWIDAGAVPPGVQRGCEWALDQAAFEAAELPPEVSAEPN